MRLRMRARSRASRLPETLPWTLGGTHPPPPSSSQASRLWRFVFGTLVGCAWSLWTLAVFGHSVGAVTISCALAAAAGTYVHALPYSGYGGLVLAFTTPLISLGQVISR